MLTVIATPEAPPATWSTIQIVGSAKQGEVELRAVADLKATFKAAWNNSPWIPPSANGAIAVGVQNARPFTLRVEPSKLVFGRELKGTIKVIAQRGEGVDEAIELATLPEKNAIPDGVSLALKPIAKGESEVTLEWAANDKAPLGEFSVVLVGTHKKEKANVSAATSAFRYQLSPPFTLTVSAASDKLPKGGEWKGKLTLVRNPAFAGVVKVSGSKLPPGVTFAELFLPADQQELELILKAGADAASAVVSDVTLKVEAVDNAKLTENLTLPAITVE